MGYGVDSGMGGFMDKALADSINGYSNEKIEKMEKEQLDLSEKSYVHTYSTFDYTPDGENSTEVSTSIDIQLPAMLKPFLGPQIQKAADQFGVMMGKIASGQGI